MKSRENIFVKIEIQEGGVGFEKISQQVLNNDTESENRWIVNDELTISLLEWPAYQPEISTSTLATDLHDEPEVGCYNYRALFCRPLQNNVKVKSLGFCNETD